MKIGSQARQQVGPQVHNHNVTFFQDTTLVGRVKANYRRREFHVGGNLSAEPLTMIVPRNESLDVF